VRAVLVGVDADVALVGQPPLSVLVGVANWILRAT
jgi:hypothetical protein